MIVKIARTFNVQFLQRRNYSRQGNVRVRFAPSPTGHLHLGGLRTALYNYLFARKNDGNFILRIEDTDQTRLEPGAMEKLQDDMVWAGIIPDEGPVRGGPKGPYIQSKRLDLYKEQVLQLLKNGSAYYCFCTEHRLELLRKDALRARLVPKYDNRCRHLDKEIVKEKMVRGDSHCIRFKLADEPKTFHDLVYGDVSIPKAEGDPVIIKTDGFPTYHFANVVDDHFMAITHVLRGVEWQISTPKHIEIYNAFGWTPPLFAHLPLILNADGTKLSKRQSGIKVDSFRKTGIFPLALLNYVTHAGGGFNRDQGGKDIYSYPELIQQFDLKRINTNSCKLQPAKLLEFNKCEIVSLLKDDNNRVLLANKVRKIVLEAFSERKDEGSLELEESHIISVLIWASNRISRLEDLVNRDLAFLWVMPASTTSTKDPAILEQVGVISSEIAVMDSTSFKKDPLNDYLRSFAKNNKIEFSSLMKILRGVLSGLDHGPAVAEMMEILGKEKTLERLNRLFIC